MEQSIEHKVEQRSEKVKKIINQEPSWMIRYGITLITIIVFILSIFVYQFIVLKIGR